MKRASSGSIILGCSGPMSGTLCRCFRRVELWSIVKITLRAQPRDYKCFGKFHERFARILPGGTDHLPGRPMQFAKLISRMLRIAAQRALASYPDRRFQPVSSFFYNDSTPMLTLTGIVCPPDCIGVVRGAYENWDFKNLDWNPPTQISVPVLSTKERLWLCRAFSHVMIRRVCYCSWRWVTSWATAGAGTILNGSCSSMRNFKNTTRTT